MYYKTHRQSHKEADLQLVYPVKTAEDNGFRKRLKNNNLAHSKYWKQVGGYFYMILPTASSEVSVSAANNSANYYQSCYFSTD